MAASPSHPRSPRFARFPDHEFDVDERRRRRLLLLRPRAAAAHDLPPGAAARARPRAAHRRRTAKRSIRRFWQPRIEVRTGLSEARLDRGDAARGCSTPSTSTCCPTCRSARSSRAASIRRRDRRRDGAHLAAPASRPSPPASPARRVDETAAAARIAEHLGCEHVVLPMRAADRRRRPARGPGGFDEPTAANSRDSALVSVARRGRACEGRAVRRRRRRAVPRLQPPALGAADGALAAAHRGARGRRPARRACPSFRSRKWNYLRQLARPIPRRRVARRRIRALLRRGSDHHAGGPRSAFTTATSSTRHEARDSFAQRALELFPAGAQRSRSPTRAVHARRPDRPHARIAAASGSTARSMAHSLEARVPFLSHRFVDWALTMPADLKLRGSTGKYVLRQAVEPWLPQGRARPAQARLPDAARRLVHRRLQRLRARCLDVRRARRMPASSIGPRSSACSTSIAAAPPTTAACSTRSRCSAAGGTSNAAPIVIPAKAGIRLFTAVKAAGPPLSRG